MENSSITYKFSTVFSLCVVCMCVCVRVCVCVCVQDLQHPNKFIRGSTLRFLCKLKEPELLEPLMPSIRSCLEHRHAYVRRNAVLAIYTIFKYVVCLRVCVCMCVCVGGWVGGCMHVCVKPCVLPPLRNFDHLIPDAPELIHSYLEGEQDASCKRNAFMMLIHVEGVIDIVSKGSV